MLEFFLHGFGSDSQEFRTLWPDKAESDLCFFLNGPEPDPFTGRRRWFPFTAQPPALQQGIEGAVVEVERVIQATLLSLGLDKTAPISVVGHSQGAMIALELVRRRFFSVEVAHCFSGYLPRTQLTPVAGRGCATDLHVYSSKNDRYIDADAVERTVRYFREIPGVTVYHHLSSTLPHMFSFEWRIPSNFVSVSYA